MLTIHLPSQMAAMAGGDRRIAVEADSVAKAFDVLDDIAPMLRSQVFRADGSLRKFVGIFVNDRQVHTPEELLAPVAAGGQVLVVQSVAGG